MIARIVTTGVAIVGCIFVLGLVLEAIQKITGQHVSELGFFPIVAALSALAVISAYGREQTAPAFEACKVFAFTGAAIIFPHVMGAWVLLLVVAGVAVVYWRPAIAGWHYLTVSLPLERAAHKQQVLTEKLDADTALAEAVLRHERAKAALEDAERVAAESAVLRSKPAGG